jgi:hypothetical protein
VIGAEGTGARTAIEIPDATADPGGYVQALVRTLGDRDPLAVYEETARLVGELCRGLSAARWETPLAPGEWNAAQIVGHLIDVDIVYGFRCRLVLTEDNPAYPGYNEKLWSQLPHPGPGELVSVLAGLRTGNVALLRHTPRSQWHRRGMHGEQGSEDFALMITKLAGHDLAHLDQLARTIAAGSQET